MTFGERIRQLRRDQRLTQRELADKVEAAGARADFTYLSRIENDKIDAPPSEELIRALAKILKADADELLDLAGKFDAKALQQVVSEMPEAGVLLRRIQSKKIPRQQIKKLLDETK